MTNEGVDGHKTIVLGTVVSGQIRACMPFATVVKLVWSMRRAWLVMARNVEYDSVAVTCSMDEDIARCLRFFLDLRYAHVSIVKRLASNSALLMLALKRLQETDEEDD